MRRICWVLVKWFFNQEKKNKKKRQKKMKKLRRNDELCGRQVKFPLFNYKTFMMLEFVSFGKKIFHRLNNSSRSSSMKPAFISTNLEVENYSNFLLLVDEKTPSINVNRKINFVPSQKLAPRHRIGINIIRNPNLYYLTYIRAMI